MPAMPAMPTWGSRGEWKTWRREHRAWERALGTQAQKFSGEHDAALPMEERLSRFRRKAVGTLGTVGSLAVVNAITSPHVWWVQWAALGLGIAWFIALFRVLRTVVLVGGIAALVAFIMNRSKQQGPLAPPRPIPPPLPTEE